MNRVLQSFIDQVCAANSESELASALTTAAGAVDMPKIAYLCISRRAMDSPLLITNYPRAWEHRYFNQGYQHIDPVVRQAFTDHIPFRWGPDDTLRGLSQRQLQFFAEAAEFGLRCGFTVPIHDDIGRIGAVTFASPEKPTVFQQGLRHNENLLHLMGIYFHVHARQTLGFGASYAWPRLSPRETQCLQWAAHGKTRWEISRILGLSQRTVAFHLDNARMKLDAASTTEAVAKAVQERLITAF